MLLILLLIRFLVIGTVKYFFCVREQRIHFAFERSNYLLSVFERSNYLLSVQAIVGRSTEVSMSTYVDMTSERHESTAVMENIV